MIIGFRCWATSTMLLDGECLHGSLLQEINQPKNACVFWPGFPFWVGLKGKPKRKLPPVSHHLVGSVPISRCGASGLRQAICNGQALRRHRGCARFSFFFWGGAASCFYFFLLVSLQNQRNRPPPCKKRHTPSDILAL